MLLAEATFFAIAIDLLTSGGITVTTPILRILYYHIAHFRQDAEREPDDLEGYRTGGDSFERLSKGRCGMDDS